MMRIHTLEHRLKVDGTPDEVFPFFADARNLEAITPPLLRFRVVPPGSIRMGAGTQVEYHLRVFTHRAHVVPALLAADVARRCASARA